MSGYGEQPSAAERDVNTVIGFLAIGTLGLLFTLGLIWPEEVKPLVHDASLAPDQALPKSTQAIQSESVNKNFDPLPLEKQDLSSQLGLGASLAIAPLPKPSSKRELPKDLSLGEHVIPLLGGEWKLRLSLTLSSEEPEFSRYAGPLRRRLIEMVYFLVSHRVPEGMREPNGEERLRQDLLSRFKNVLRGQEFELYLDAYSLEAASEFTEDE